MHMKGEDRQAWPNRRKEITLYRNSLSKTGAVERSRTNDARKQVAMSKSYSWKAPEEPYKVARAAIAASALSTSGVQQSEGRKGQNCNSCQTDTYE